MTKNELRRAAVARLRSIVLAATVRRGASAEICRAIKQQRAWQEAALVCAFLPLPSEPQIAPLWDRERGPDFCFPRVAGSGLELIRVADRALLRRADWKLAAPEFERAPTVAPESVDLFLVPGAAFTADGRRLGRGGGYYDRLLAQRSRRSTALGVCFAIQLLDSIPIEPHDQHMDAVITERGAAS